MKMAYLACAFMAVLSLRTQAQELSQQSLFNRCYVQLTGKPMPLNHALMKQVKTGTLRAVDACTQILNKGKLTAGNQIANVNDAEAKAVLNTFYSFHRTWFPSNALDTVTFYDPIEQNGTMDVYDATEPALSLTFTMFGAGQKYSDTLTRPRGVRAIRVEDPAVKARQEMDLIGSRSVFE